MWHNQSRFPGNPKKENLIRSFGAFWKHPMLELSSYLPMKMISSKNLEINTLGSVMEIERQRNKMNGRIGHVEGEKARYESC